MVQREGTSSRKGTKRKQIKEKQKN